ncbi:MAG: CDP-diacylglycerol--serine O-phosphatidyltransferase [Coxiella sp. (in: Bacteria)]|nr:MAG: CDP-diacylglycerol--serine O-phosphatidyltransferase [Coxiella sp. (in: g-proteobacteria)]
MSNEKPSTNRGMRGIYLLPNLFTLAALFAGFFAIIAATKQQFESAAIAIFIAMILDALDGRVARLTHSQTDFGAEFDSLSDMVSFGLCPALVLYYWSLVNLGKVGWLVSFLYTACTALRLARFNLKDQNEEKRYFQGLSTTAAAGFIAGFIWVCAHNGVSGSSEHMRIITIILTAMVALLKVSTIRYRSFKDIDVRGRVPFMTILVAVLLLVLVCWAPADVLFGIFGAYVASGPIMWCFNRIRRNRH